MTKTITKLALVVALFCGTILADDGNMGSGGYTGCGTTNPPPACPPAGNGFANTGDFNSKGDGLDTAIFAEIIVETLEMIF